MKDKTTSLSLMTRNHLDTVFKPGKILVMLGTVCVTPSTPFCLQPAPVQLLAFSLLVKLAGQLYRIFITVPTKMRCHICPKHHSFGHIVTVQSTYHRIFCK